MSATAFTPGPWRLRNATSATVLARREHTNALGHTTVWQSPVAVAQPWSADQRIANAHLIAAAPDLYDAVGRVIGIIVGTFAEGGDIHQQCLAALAKARGEQ